MVQLERRELQTVRSPTLSKMFVVVTAWPDDAAWDCGRRVPGSSWARCTPEPGRRTAYAV